MRKVSAILVLAFLVFSGKSFAHGNNAVDPSENLSAQIQALLKQNSFQIIEDELVANVRFTLNKEGEIVVLSVYTESLSLEGFVKGRLNYQKVNVSNIVEGKIYTVPVKITA